MNETDYSQAYAAPAPRRRWGRTLLLIILVVLIVAGALWYFKDRGLPVPGASQPAAAADAAAPDKLSDAQVQSVIAQVGKHILLPSDETPIIATVTDAATLRAQQPFYKDVSDGDYLLIYQSQARAILFDPNKDMLVNVGAIQVPPPAATSTSSTAASAK